MTKMLLSTLVLSCLLFGCSSALQYMGTTNGGPSFRQPDLFFAEADIDRPYRVLGNLFLQEDPLLTTAERVQQMMIERAMEIGADALLIQDIETQQNGEDCDDLIFRAKALVYQ